MSVPVEGGGGVGPQVNKFEQASNHEYQLSVVGWGGGVGPQV